MKRRALSFLAAIVAAAWVGAGSASASSTTYNEMLESMMEAQGQDAVYIGTFFGPDAATTLSFTSILDPATGEFSYATEAGQSYLGQSISLSTVGTYDEVLRVAAWTISGQLGATSWTGVGSIAWSGDPTGTINTTVTLGGKDYKVAGTLDFTVDQNGVATSKGKYTFTGPPGGPFAGPFGPYDGTDTFGKGTWRHEIKVPKNPVTPNGLVILALGQVPAPPQGGAGNFKMQIKPVPEPSSLLLAGVGAAAILLCSRRRRSGATAA